jgi:hypothetical protein
MQRAHGARLVSELCLGEIQKLFIKSEMDHGVGLQGTVRPCKP